MLELLESTSCSGCTSWAANSALIFFIASVYSLRDGVVYSYRLVFEYNRHNLLAKALGWIAQRDGLADGASGYMAMHQHDPNASPLKRYYRDMIDWVKEYFPTQRAARNGVDWGRLYNEHHERTDLDAAALEARVRALMSDDEGQRKQGIYEFVLLEGQGVRKESLLNLRAFSDSDKQTMWERQGRTCADPTLTGHDPNKEFELKDMQADHIDPWHSGGGTTLTNGRMLCEPCNRRKSGS